MIWLRRISLFVSRNGETDAYAKVLAWYSSAGSAEVEFLTPITSLSEQDIVNLLKACRIARKQYKAADFITIKD